MTRTQIIWLLGWVAVSAAIAWGLMSARQAVITRLASDAGRADWQAFKEASDEGRLGGGAIQRRPIKSNEPPALVLLRDHFAAVLGSSLLIGTFVYAFLAFTIQGSIRAPNRRQQTKLDVEQP